MKKLSLFKSNPQLFHGGALVGKRKSRRPLCSKRPLHIVLKSKGRNLYLKRELLKNKIELHSKKYGLKIYSLAINLDHIHFLVKIPNRDQYKNFIRALTGNLATIFGTGLWALSPFTRVIQWGRDYRFVLSYLKKNREEASGMRPYEKRKDWYGRYLRPGASLKSHIPLLPPG